MRYGKTIIGLEEFDNSLTGSLLHLEKSDLSEERHVFEINHLILIVNTQDERMEVDNARAGYNGEVDFTDPMHDAGLLLIPPSKAAAAFEPSVQWPLRSHLLAWAPGGFLGPSQAVQGEFDH